MALATLDLYGLAVADLHGLDPSLGASNSVGEPVVSGECSSMLLVVQGTSVTRKEGLSGPDKPRRFTP